MIQASSHDDHRCNRAESEKNQWLKDFTLTWLGRFGVFLAHHVTRPLIPLYLITFGASSTVIGAVMAAFTVTATAMRIPIGLYIDRIGRKPFLLSGIVFFAVGKLGYLWAPSIPLMLPFRVLHGLGWSGCTTAVSTISADIVPPARRGELMGYAGMASSLASALGTRTRIRALSPLPIYRRLSWRRRRTHFEFSICAASFRTAERRGQSLAQFQFSYDLGIGIGSLTLGALLDLVNQSFLIMYLATAESR